MMDITKSREEFEAAISNGLINHGLAKFKSGDYVSETTRSMFMAFKAGRESIEIDLEHLGYIQIEEGVFCLDYHTVKALLTSSGIRIKGESE